MRKRKNIICAGMTLCMLAGSFTGCERQSGNGEPQTTITTSEADTEEKTTSDTKNTEKRESIAAKYREKEEKNRQEIAESYSLTDNAVMESSESCAEESYEMDAYAENVVTSSAPITDSQTNYEEGSYEIGEPYVGEAYDTREYDYTKEHSFVSTADAPLSTFAADTDTASYSNVRSYIESKTLPPADAVRIEEMLNYFTYDYKTEPKEGEKFAIYTEYTDCPWNDDTRLMMVGINTAEIDFDEKQPSNLVFLIDTSGSMYDENKLPLAQRAFQMLAEDLGENDRISIVTYAGTDTVVLSGESGENQYTIIETLNGLQAAGSTNGSGGLISAYETAEQYFIEGGNNRVILATDGDMNVGLTSESDLVNLITEEKESGIFLSVLGFGQDNLKDNRLEALADYGDGNYAYIDSIYEAKKVLTEEMGGTLYTVAKDVKFQIEFNPEYVKGYRQIGYENRALADADFDNDTVDGGEIGAGHVVTVLYEVVPANSDYEVPEADTRYSARITDDETKTAGEGELATINIRYKEPDASVSTLVSEAVQTDAYSSRMSSDMSFAAAVAAYGMLLKESEYIGKMDYPDVIRLAKEGLPEDTALSDENAETDEQKLAKIRYREQFVYMVQQTSDLYAVEYQ